MTGRRRTDRRQTSWAWWVRSCRGGSTATRTREQARSIVLAPVFAWLWIRLGNYEPTTPTKFAFGLFFVGLSFLFLLIPAAAIQGTPGLRVSPFWLVGCYFIQELGELSISPVGLSVF